MADRSCCSCNTLREHAPDFSVNGVTDSVCTSLQNDTGLNANAETINDDFTDLHMANDCLIGNLEDEVEDYEVCDLPKFFAKILPNIYHMFKAIICAIGGIWIKIHEFILEINMLEDFVLKSPKRLRETKKGNAYTKGHLTPTEPAADGVWAEIHYQNGVFKDNEFHAIALSIQGINTNVGHGNLHASSLASGDVVAFFSKESILENDVMTETQFNRIAEREFQQPLMSIGGGGICYAKLTGSDDGKGLNLVVNSVIGSATGACGTVANPLKVL